MADPGLALTYDDLAEIVGVFLGWGSDDTAWTDDETADIDRIIQSGYAQFLNPPPLPGRSSVHEWSFMKPWTTLSLSSGDYDYNLPPNFGGMIGKFYYDATALHKSIDVINAGLVLQHRAQTGLSGDPWEAAIQSLGAGANSQRFQVIFYPEPDTSRTLNYQYAVTCDKLSASSNPNPLGGVVHRETLIESCLAMAEQRVEDSAGLHTDLFYRHLKASILRDSQGMSPKALGYCGDDSDIPRELITRATSVTYSGS